MIVTEIFEHIAEKFQNKDALVFRNQKFTYKEINSYANRLARFLIGLNVRKKDRIGIYLNECSEMVTSIFGVLKTGASYVPMPDSFPLERVQDIVEDAGIQILLTKKDLAAQLENFNPKIKIICLDEMDLTSFESSHVFEKCDPEDCVYSIYTSGSTGKPKGVSISHKNLVTLCEDIIKRCGLSERDNATKYAGYGFDASVLEIFPSFLSGGTLHVLDKDIKLNVSKLSHYFEEHKITHCFLPTQFAEIFMHEYPNQKYLRNMIVGGDRLKKVRLGTYKIFNMYGPTETTVAATSFEVDREDYRNIPIGKPLDNYKIYIVDHHMNLCPVGVVGELCIAGEGVGLGYINLPQITAEKFILNPFATSEELKQNKNTRIYRTGDLAKWLPCGNIEFLGRIDFQVKIRGFRIELEEIEHKLSSLPGVEDCIVLALKDKNENDYLCGYYTSKNQISDLELNDTLSKSLPDYMVPSVFQWMEAFPINPNGKIDRKKLPKPALREEEFVPPRNEKEEKIAQFMSEILCIEKISVKSNFFHRGGNSLKAVLLVSKLQTYFDIKVSDIFNHKTVENISNHVFESSNQFQISKQNLDRYPLTAAQRGIYFASIIDDRSTIYNLPIALEINGNLDRNRLGKAIDGLILKHRILRTKCVLDGENIFQVVCDDLFIAKDFQKTRMQELSTLFSEFVRPFDLLKGPLFRVKLLQIENRKHVLFMDIHHIVSDGFSQNLFLKELFSFYKDTDQIESDCRMSQAKPDYLDYSVFEQDLSQNTLRKTSKEYWAKKDLSGEKVHIPMDYPEDRFCDDGNSFEYEMDETLCNSIDQLASQLGVTKYVICLCAYALLISKCARADVVTVGGFFSGRSLSCIQDAFGMFVSTLPITVDLSGPTESHLFLIQLQQQIAQILENQNFSMTELMEQHGVSNINGRNPFFNNAFNFVELENYVDSDIQTQYLNVANHQKAHFDLTLTCYQMPKKMKFVFEYSKLSYKPETLKTAIASFVEILKTFMQCDTQIQHIPFADQEQRDLILKQFNKTEALVDEQRTIVQRFEDCCQKFKYKNALVFKNQTFTYGSLNQYANCLSRYLARHGVTQNCRVGLYLNESLEMITGIFGILKCGASYVPMPDTFPAERIADIIQDAGIQVLLTRKDVFVKSDCFDPNLHVVYLEQTELSHFDETNPILQQSLEDCVYSIYTSGSTGKPKGVSISQKNLIHLTEDIIKRCGLSEKDNSVKYAGYGFDASILEIFPSLLSGCTLHILDKETKLDILKLNQYMESHEITYCFFPTQFAEIYVQEFPNSNCLKYMLVGGDKLKKIRCGNYKILNVYGPTETTVVATIFELDNADYKNIPIGKPIDNYKTYIVDKHMNLCPVGVVGELCISGEGVGLGYINLAHVTAEKFITNPFVTEEERAQNKYGRMYRTGDLAKWLEDGNIEFLGRIDFQVKIRGFRIELGEIEHKLLLSPEIAESVVLALKDKNGSDYLCAYYTSQKQINEDILREQLAKTLPDYMIPSVFYWMEKFPINPNGKVDRKKLPVPELKEEEMVAPSNTKEKTIVQHMAEVLGLEKMSVDSNFFHMGGNSLKAVLLVSRLQNSFDIKVSDIFQYNSAKNIAAHVQEHEHGLSIEKRLECVQEKIRNKKRPSSEVQNQMNKLTEEYMQKIEKYNAFAYEKKENLFPLVTGATGYLGSHIVLEILSNTHWPCAVLIRGQDVSSSQKRLYDTLEHYWGEPLMDAWKTRIQVFVGDICEPLFKLKHEDYSFLLSHIDCVVNAAANVKHYGEYSSFYRDNVTSVVNLIEFCKQSQSALHHVSTYSVSIVEKGMDPAVAPRDDIIALPRDDRGDVASPRGLTAGSRVDPIFTEYHMRDSNLLLNPYVKTKMVAEEEIFKAQQNSEFCANVYRVGNLVFNTKTNLHQINIDNNGFYQNLKCLFNIGCACTQEELDCVELSPVNETAHAIFLLMQQKNLKKETFHVYNPHFYQISKLFEFKLNAVDLDVFLDKMSNFYGCDFTHSMINNYMLHAGWLNLEDNVEHIPIQNEKTNFILSKLGFHWSSMSNSNFSDMIDHAYADRYHVLEQNNVLSPLGVDFVKDISLLGKLHIVKENEVVMSHKIQKKSLYFILDGFAQISVLSSLGGWISTIGVLSQNDLIGIENMVDFENKNMIVDSVLGDLVLLELSLENFEYLKNKYRRFFDRILFYALKTLHNNNLLISNFA